MVTNPSGENVVRRDRYTVMVEGCAVRADAAQEQRIRAMDDDARARFLAIMGHAIRPGVTGE